MVKYSDSEKNSLTEQIKRILREEYDSKKTRLSNFIFARFDEVFDKLKLERTDDDVYQYNWYYKEDGKKVFERNHWGRFWIYDCTLYEELLIIPRSIGMSFEEFQSILISYLNNRYESEFNHKPLKDIGNENCVNDDFFFQELDETEINKKINESKDNIDLNKLSKVLNSFMKNQYDWWKEITISEIKSATIGHVGKQIKSVKFCGKLIVNDDWLQEQIINYDYRVDSSKITLGDVIGQYESKELRQEIQSVLNSVFKISDENVRYGSFDCIYVDSEPDQDITNQMEINERCWKGYTQKGMKTMFGKRYPNCVKKKK
jgi:hypothetical protein